MSRLPRRPLVLAAALVLAVTALLRYGVLVAILVLLLGVIAAVLVGQHQAGKLTIRKKRRQGPIWKPTVHHQELPAPADDPVIGFGEPAGGAAGREAGGGDVRGGGRPARGVASAGRRRRLLGWRVRVHPRL